MSGIPVNDRLIHTKSRTPFDIQVETVKDDIAKGTWETISCPFRCDWTKGTPDPVGKIIGRVLACNVLAGRRSASSQRQEDLLSSILAEGDVFHDLMAIGKEATGLISIHEKGSITLVAKVGLGPSGQTDVWKDVDKANVDNIQRGFSTERAQTLLVCTLTLGMLSVCCYGVI
jgi:hypothetical protein